MALSPIRVRRRQPSPLPLPEQQKKEQQKERWKRLRELILLPLAINLATSAFFYWLGLQHGAKDEALRAKKEAAIESAKQAALANSYVSYGSVDLSGGPGTLTSTHAVATVRLYTSSDFSDVALRLYGGEIEGARGNDLSGFLDSDAGGPQSIKIHLEKLTPQLTTCLTVPVSHASKTFQKVWVKQSFKPRQVDADGTPTIEFTPAGGGPVVERNDGTCLAFENGSRQGR